MPLLARAIERLAYPRPPVPDTGTELSEDEYWCDTVQDGFDAECNCQPVPDTGTEP